LDTAFVFTENAQANAQNLGLEPVGPARTVKLDVNYPGNQANIRRDSKGNRNENAFGIIVKKYQQKLGSEQFVTAEGQFEDTQEDFELFKKLNLDMFERLEQSDYQKIVFPF
jgi:hypothetical protein